jgi:hypothetical protein
MDRYPDTTLSVLAALAAPKSWTAFGMAVAATVFAIGLGTSPTGWGRSA